MYMLVMIPQTAIYLFSNTYFIYFIFRYLYKIVQFSEDWFKIKKINYSSYNNRQMIYYLLFY